MGVKRESVKYKARWRTSHGPIVAACLYFATSVSATTTGVGDYIAQGLAVSTTSTAILNSTQANASAILPSTSSGTGYTYSSPIPTACAAYQTALPDNTLGWYTTGANLTIPGVVSTWQCDPTNYPCNVICAADRPDCISSASSIAHTCSPQWSAYSCSYSSYVSQHITGSYTTAYGDIATKTILAYPTTVTANTSFTFQAWGGNETVITPVYVFGSPTPVSTVVSTNSDYKTFTVASANPVYWSSTTDVESTYWTTYTTAYLDMYQRPLTDMYPVPTPACSITEVYSNTCAASGCEIYGGTVQVYYWPGVTPGPDGVFANTTKPTDPSTTEVDGITMTSPSVYVSFDTVYAANSCRRIGNGYAGTVLAFDPASISTVYGGPGFLSEAIPNGASVFNFGDLGPTVNAAAYERQVKCIVETGCSTIFPDYNPTISVPLELRSLDPAWSTCYGDFRGFYDPPKALQPVPTEAGPSGPNGYTTSATPGPTVTSPQAVNTGGPTSGDASSPKASASTSGGETAAPIIMVSQTSLQPATTTTPVLQSYSVPGSPQSDLIPSSAKESAQAASSPSNNDGTQTGSGAGSQHTTNPGGIIGSLFGHSSDPSGAQPALTLPETTLMAGSSSEYLVGTHTLAPGSPAVVESGTTWSLDPSGSAIIVNGVTQSLPHASLTSNGPGSVVANGHTYGQASSSGLVVGSHTIDPGHATVISGTMYSLDPSNSAIVVNGVTQSFQAVPASETILSIGSEVLTADPTASGFVIGSQTLTEGGTVTVGSGTAAQTLHLTTHDGKTVIVTGSTSSATVGAASQSSDPQQSASTTAVGSPSAAATTPASTSSRSSASAVEVRPTTVAMLVLAALCFIMTL